MGSRSSDVGDAEAAADVQQAHWRRRFACQLAGERDRLLLCIDDRVGTQVLRATEDVKATEFEGQAGQLA
jgi:hypothetical protein